MRITYDPDVDAMYIEFNDKQPEGATPVTGLINLYTTEDDVLVGIELFRVSTYSDSIEALAARFARPLAQGATRSDLS